MKTLFNKFCSSCLSPTSDVIGDGDSDEDEGKTVLLENGDNEPMEVIEEGEDDTESLGFSTSVQFVPRIKLNPAIEDLTPSEYEKYWDTFPKQLSTKISMIGTGWSPTSAEERFMKLHIFTLAKGNVNQRNKYYLYCEQLSQNSKERNLYLMEIFVDVSEMDVVLRVGEDCENGHVFLDQLGAFVHSIKQV